MRLTQVNAILRAAEASPQHLEEVPRLLAQLEGDGSPAGALGHIGCTAQRSKNDAYCLALAQEARLQCYAGLRLSWIAVPIFRAAAAARLV